MLEIRLPREIMKSPAAMEVALLSLLPTGGVGDWYAKIWQGNLPFWSSLEIASIEGTIHFYIRLNKKFRPLVESNLYAQYPGIEISEASDYTKLIRYHHLKTDTVNCWGVTYPLGEKWEPKKDNGDSYKDEKGKDLKMPADFYPLKTYVDYGLDKDPDEEFKTDPITPLLEFMGSIGAGEHVWYQVLVQDESVFNGIKFPKTYVNKDTHEHMSLEDMAKQYKKQLRTASYKKKGDIVYDDYGDAKKKKSGKDSDGNDILIDQTYSQDKVTPKKETELTIEEKDEIEAINRKLSKPLVRAVVRLLYVTKKQNFNPHQIQNTLAIMRPFTGTNKFGISPTDPYDFPWQDMGKRRSNFRAEERFESYVEREGFHPHIPAREGLDRWEDMFFYPYSIKSRKIFRMIYESIFHPFSHPAAKEVITLNLEELATLWHFPGQVAGTPTLPRIDSTKGVAPVNLPR
jgi:hypothetical protein